MGRKRRDPGIQSRAKVDNVDMQDNITSETNGWRSAQRTILVKLEHLQHHCTLRQATKIMYRSPLLDRDKDMPKAKGGSYSGDRPPRDRDRSTPFRQYIAKSRDRVVVNRLPRFPRPHPALIFRVHDDDIFGSETWSGRAWWYLYSLDVPCLG